MERNRQLLFQNLLAFYETTAPLIIFPQDSVIFGCGSAGYILFKSLNKIINVVQEKEI